MLFASLTRCAQSFRPTRKGCIYIFRSCKLIIPVISLTHLLFIFMMFPGELTGPSRPGVWSHPPHLNASSDHLCVSRRKREKMMRSDAAPEMKRHPFLSLHFFSYGLNSFFFFFSCNNQELCSRSPAES